MQIKNAAFIIFTCFISSQLIAAPFCGLPYKTRPKSLIGEEMKELKSLNRLDNMTNFIRRYKVKNSETFSYIEKIKNRHNIIDTEVVAWNVDSAIRKWRPLFRKVEGSALYIEKYQVLQDLLESTPSVRLTEALLDSKKISKVLKDEVFFAKKNGSLAKYKKQIAKNIKKETGRLGNNFYEYQYVKRNLEKLETIHCNPECLAQLERVKSEVGITSVSERSYFKELVGNRKNLKLSFVEDIFQNNIYAFTTAQRVELFHELGSFLGSYVREVDLFWKVMKRLSDKSWVQQRAIAKMFKAVYDRRAKIISDPLINQIVRVHTEASATLGGIKRNIRKMRNGDGMLVDFARRDDGLTQGTWKDVKDFAFKNDKDFYNKMVKAEEIAGFLGRRDTHLPRGFYYALGGVAVGSVFFLYGGFETSSSPSEAPSSGPTEPSSQNEPALNLPLYPDDDDTVETVIIGEKDYSEILRLLENNADIFEDAPLK